MICSSLTHSYSPTIFTVTAMAEDAISWESSTPSIRVNDVDIVEVCHRPQKKRVENQAVRRKRLAAQHDLRTCGCTCRDGLAAQHICQVLYELAKKEQQQNCNELTELWKTPRYFRSSEPVSNAIKRPHQVAFPSSFFGREACLNFFHKRATMELELNKGTSIAPGHDVKRERNNIRFRKSEASTSFIPYNFQNSYRQKKKTSEEGRRAYAPYTLLPRGDDSNLLHPNSADVFVRRHKSARREQDRIIPHILWSFLPRLTCAPQEAFSKVTGGLKRAWLHEACPQFFTTSGELQEYVIHNGKPLGLSQTLWIWFCGRDTRLPEDGPNSLALKIAIESANDLRSKQNYLMKDLESKMRQHAEKYELEFEQNTDCISYSQTKKR